MSAPRRPAVRPERRSVPPLRRADAALKLLTSMTRYSPAVAAGRVGNRNRRRADASRPQIVDLSVGSPISEAEDS